MQLGLEYTRVSPRIEICQGLDYSGAKSMSRARSIQRLGLVVSRACIGILSSMDKDILGFALGIYKG